MILIWCWLVVLLWTFLIKPVPIQWMTCSTHAVSVPSKFSLIMIPNKQTTTTAWNIKLLRKERKKCEHKYAHGHETVAATQKQPMNYGCAKRCNYENYAEQIENMQKSMSVQVRFVVPGLQSHQMADVVQAGRATSRDISTFLCFLPPFFYVCLLSLSPPPALLHARSERSPGINICVQSIARLLNVRRFSLLRALHIFHRVLQKRVV